MSINKANSNIMDLIDICIEYKRDEFRNYCIHPQYYKGNVWKKEFCHDMPSCSGCKQLALDEIRNSMLDKYLIKE